MSEKSKPYILISSCLLGLDVRYDEKNKTNEILKTFVKSGKAVFFCPEQGGGLPTPREPAEIEEGKNSKDVLSGNGKVISKEGRNMTEQFIKGANRALQICKDYNLSVAILKEKSPSCGSEKAYDGTFTGKKIEGTGITAELLKQNGIKVYSEENFPKDL